MELSSRHVRTSWSSAAGSRGNERVEQCVEAARGCAARISELAASGAPKLARLDSNQVSVAADKEREFRERRMSVRREDRDAP